MHAGAHPYIHAYILTCSQSCTHTYINPCTHTWARLRALPLGAGGESQRCWQMRGGNRTRNTLAFPTCLAQKRHLWDCVLRGNGIGLAGRRLHSSPKVPLTRSSHLWDCMLRGNGIGLAGRRLHSSPKVPLPRSSRCAEFSMGHAPARRRCLTTSAAAAGYSLEGLATPKPIRACRSFCAPPPFGL